VQNRAAKLVLVSLLNFAVCSKSVAIPQNTIEVVQAIQSMEQDVKLVAGKTTIVRVYLDGSENKGLKVTGRLEITRVNTGKTTKIDAINSVDIDATQGASPIDQHDDIRKSLNFLIAPEWTSSGRVSFRLAEIILASNKQPLPCTTCATVSKTLSFFGVPALKVKVILLAYNVDGISPFAYPSDADIASIKSWLSRAYPTSQLILSIGELDAKSIGLSGHFKCNDVDEALGAVRLKEVTDGGVDPLTHYYGLVSDKYFLMSGCSTVPDEPDARVVASGPAGIPARHPDVPEIYWDKGPIFTGWYAGHEIAHTFGRAHPGKCGESKDDSDFPYEMGRLSNRPEKYIGLDVGDKSDGTTAVVLPGLKWSDVMTYCPDRWISQYTYDGIFTRLYAENGQNPNGGPGPQLQAQQNPAFPSSAKFIDIIASINFTKASASFKYVRKSDFPYFRLAGEKGEATLSTLDQNGKVIQTFHAHISRYTDIHRDAEETATVRTSIPYDDRISSLALEVNEKIRATYSGGGTRAAVSDLVVKNAIDLSGEEFAMMTSASQAEGASKGLLVKWKAVGEGVKYTVEISGNKGSLWSTIAVDLSENYLTIVPERLGLSEGSNLLVRVTANDGFKSTAVETTSITVRKQR
jgi:hypothetical protein